MHDRNKLYFVTVEGVATVTDIVAHQLGTIWTRQEDVPIHEAMPVGLSPILLPPACCSECPAWSGLGSNFLLVPF